MLIKKESAAKQAAKVTKLWQATVVMNHRISFKGSGNDRKLVLTKNGLELSCLSLPEHSGLTCETLQDCPIIIEITDAITNLEWDVSTLLNPNYVASQIIPLLVHNEHVNIIASFDNVNNRIVLTGTWWGGWWWDFDCDDVASCIANNAATQLALLNWIQWLENLLLNADITLTWAIRFEGNNVLFKDGTVDYENTEISYDVNTISNHNGDVINFNNSDIDISNGSLDLTSTSVTVDDSNINVSDTTINYSNTDLVWGNYSNTTITDSTISNTTLTDVNIDNSTITNTTLDGVTITGTLNLPDGSVKPTHLAWTTTNGAFVVRNDNNTFRDATSSDIEDLVDIESMISANMITYPFEEKLYIANEDIAAWTHVSKIPYFTKRPHQIVSDAVYSHSSNTFHSTESGQTFSVPYTKKIKSIRVMVSWPGWWYASSWSISVQLYNAWGTMWVNGTYLWGPIGSTSSSDWGDLNPAWVIRTATFTNAITIGPWDYAMKITLHTSRPNGLSYTASLMWDNNNGYGQNVILPDWSWVAWKSIWYEILFEEDSVVVSNATSWNTAEYLWYAHDPISRWSYWLIQTRGIVPIGSLINKWSLLWVWNTNSTLTTSPWTARAAVWLSLWWGMFWLRWVSDLNKPVFNIGTIWNWYEIFTAWWFNFYYNGIITSGNWNWSFSIGKDRNSYMWITWGTDWSFRGEVPFSVPGSYYMKFWTTMWNTSYVWHIQPM